MVLNIKIVNFSYISTVDEKYEENSGIKCFINGKWNVVK